MNKKEKIKVEQRKVRLEQKMGEKKIRSSKIYKELKKQEEIFEAEIEKLNEDEGNLEKELYSSYLTNYSTFVCYVSSSSDWGSDGEKNIDKSVIEAIKFALEIKNIGLLKGSDVERITESIIEIEKKENEEYNKKLKEIRNKRKKFREREREAGKEKDKLFIETRKLDSKWWDLNDKLNQIEVKEKIDNPKIKKQKQLSDKRYDARKRLEEMDEGKFAREVYERFKRLKMCEELEK